MNTESSFVLVTKLDQLSVEQGKAFRVNDYSVALFRLSSGEVYAIENSCPHIGAPLDNGIINQKSCELTCLWHGWCFNLKTGDSINYKGAKIRTFPTKVSNNQVFIDIPKLKEEN